MRLFLFFLGFSSMVSAQIEPFSQDFTHDLKIYYFPFYNGTQLVEVDYFAQSLARGAWGDQVYPRGGSDYHDAIMFDRANGFILRNEKGEVIETYGINDINSLQLLPPNESTTITHKERLNSVKVSWYDDGGNTWKDANGYGYRFRIESKTKDDMERFRYVEVGVGIIDTLGNVVIKDVSTISHANGEYLVSQEGKYAIYDSTFTKTMDYVEGTVSRVGPKRYFHVSDDTKIIDRYGQQVDKDNYVRIEKSRYSGDYIYSSRTIAGIRYGVMRSNLTQLTPPIYSNIYPLVKGHGYAVSKMANKWALLNRNGERITDFEFERDAFWYYEDGTYTVYRRGDSFKQGMIDTLGNEIIPIIYDRVKEFKNGLAVVSLRGKEGIVNRKGEVQGEIAYSKIINIYSKHVHVSVQGKQGIISHTGEVIVEPVYRSVSCFDSDFLYIWNDQKECFFFDVNARKLNPCTYDNTGCFDQGFCKVSEKGKQGMIDSNMKVLIPLEYDYVSPMKGGTVVVKKGDYYGLYNSDFELVKPLKFKSFKANGQGGYKVY